MQETWVRYLGWEDPLEKGWATHSRILGLPMWLRQQRIHLPTQGTRVQSLVQKIPHAMGQLSLCTASTEPVCPESTLCNERSHCNEKPRHLNEESAHA